nr:hypothetical protein [Azospirillum palustre]
MAVSEPAIADGLPPLTRLRVAPLPFSNATLAPWPMEKLSQLTMPRLPCWVTVMVAPVVAMPPLPATNPPPVGRVCADSEPLMTNRLVKLLVLKMTLSHPFQVMVPTLPFAQSPLTIASARMDPTASISPKLGGSV